MADTTIFGRLKRLFSTQAVVRNVGGRKLRVVDSSQTQAWGVGSSMDRFQRVYSAGQYGYGVRSQYDNTGTYQYAKIQLYADYELMDKDPIISSVLDIYADESTVKDEFGDLLKITSSNDQIQKILHNLFYDILNIEFSLWQWTRNMCKFGDMFLFLMIDPDLGVVNVLPISPYLITRHEGENEENPFEVYFTLDNNSTFIRREDDKLEFFEVAHFRLLSDMSFMPYGRSMLENGRRVYKQLRLMEDAMLIHRITRAPDKRVFKVDVGNIPPGEIDNAMRKIRDETQRAEFVDEKTGDYNLKFAMMNIMEDFYLPTRGKDSGTQIESLSGLTFNAIEDIQYLLKRLLAAFKVPNSFLGYEEEVNGKATLASQDVRFARTIERVQRIIVSELQKIAIVHLYVQGFRDEELVDFQLSLTNPSTVYELEKINLWKEKIGLADQMVQGRFLSREWIYNNILEVSDEEMIVEQSKVKEDAEFEAELQKIAQEAMQPSAAAPGAGQPQMENSMDPEYDDFFGADKATEDVNQVLARLAGKETRGRPREGLKYGSDAHKLGRDPLGYKEMMGALDVHYKNKKKGKSHVDPSLRESFKQIEKKFDIPNSPPEYKNILKD
ncbi:MAG: portal protein [Betaproteobacteria bacterium]|jgi:hypothetical protein